jgi:sortase (surface protein transpeptidase)
VECSSTKYEAVAPPPSSTTTTTTKAPHRKAVKPRIKGDPPVPAALFTKDLSLRAGPVPVPLQLLIPSINVTSQVLGVGVTAGDVMDAPEGPANDPVWQEAFWYRGSAIPGVISTAVIAGHINGPRGIHAVFGEVGDLRQGDLIIVRDTRTQLDVRFKVTGYTSFTLEEATHADVLRKIYGDGPVAGTTPQRAPDGLAHLTLVTCAGTFNTGLGTHDHRLAVFATRVV